MPTKQPQSSGQLYIRYDRLVLTFQEFDWVTDETWMGSPVSPELLYLTVCITGEAGEIAEKVKKWYRDGGERRGFGFELTRECRTRLLLELGDVLYYLSRMAQALGSSLEEVAQKNVEKLASRKARGVLHGDGDER